MRPKIFLDEAHLPLLFYVTETIVRHLNGMAQAREKLCPPSAEVLSIGKKDNIVEQYIDFVRSHAIGWHRLFAGVSVRLRYVDDRSRRRMISMCGARLVIRLVAVCVTSNRLL